MDSDFKAVTEGFEKSVTALQDNLQYLADHDKVSDSFIARQNTIIRNLITYQSFAEQHIAWQEQELLSETQLRRTTLKKYQDEIVSLEAVCIIHGIVDFTRFLRLGKLTLIRQAEEFLKDKSFRLSYRMNEKLKKLSKTERHTIETILFRELNTQIRTLLKKMKASKNKFIYGTGIQTRNKKQQEDH